MANVETRDRPPAGRVMPSPRRAHQRFSRNLLVVLHAHVHEHDLGEAFDAPFDVILENTSIVVPGLLFVSRDRLAIVTERGVEGALDLIVEILSSATARRDRVEKAQLYARHGVGAASFEPSLFPGLMISLRDLWG